MSYGGNEFFQGVVLDVTEMVTLRERLRLLLDYVPEDFILVRSRDGRYEYEVMADGLARSLGYTKEEYRDMLPKGGYLEQGYGDGFPELLHKISCLSDLSLIHIWASGSYRPPGPSGTCRPYRTPRNHRSYRPPGPSGTHGAQR